MPDESVEPVQKTTPDIVQEQIERLTEIFAECVSEGEVEKKRQSI